MISGWPDNRKDPGRVCCERYCITSQRMGAFGRIKFDVPLFGEHE